MHASHVLDQVENVLRQAGYIVRWIPQEVSLRIGKEVYVEVSSLTMDPSDPTAYEWNLILTFTIWEQSPKSCLDELQKLMVVLDKANYEGIMSWQIESASVNAMGSWFEGDLGMLFVWIEEVSW